MPKKSKAPSIFSSFCKLCLSTTADLIDINSEEQPFDIVEVIFETLDIRLLKTASQFPNQYVCQNCMNIVSFIKKFKEGCKQVQETLSKYVIRNVLVEIDDNSEVSEQKELNRQIDECHKLYEKSLRLHVENYKKLYDLHEEEEVKRKADYEEVTVIKVIVDGVEQDVKIESVTELEAEEYEVHDAYEENIEYILEESLQENDEREKDEKLVDSSTDEFLNEGPEATRKRKEYKSHQCDLCNKFFDGYGIKFHMNSHLKIFPYKCDEIGCDRKFTAPSHLSHHKKTAHTEVAEKPKEHLEHLQTCPVCSLQFTRKKLYGHLRKEHNQACKCEADGCEEVFQNLLKLKKHMKRAHQHPKQKYTCELCGKAFRKTRLKYHMNTHLNIKPYVCDFEACNKSFPDPSQLSVHKRINHLKIIKITCKICAKPFKTKADHDIHFTYHGQPSLPCQICGRLLMNRKTMAKHMLTHTGEKNYKCTFADCTKAFPNSAGLTVHLRSHTKEKPYGCQDCSEKFSYRIGLRRHAQKVHGKTI